MSGFIRFESTTPDASSTPDLGQYNGAVIQSQVSIGAWTVTQDPGAFFHDFLVSSAPGNAFAFTAVDAVDPTGAYLAIPVMTLELPDPANAFFTTKSLPLDPPPLSLLSPFGADPILGFGTDFGVLGSAGDFRAELTSLRLPEPAELALAIGAVALALVAGRRAFGVARWSPREAIDEPSAAALRDFSRALPPRP